MTEKDLKLEFLKDTGLYANKYPDEYIHWVITRLLTFETNLRRIMKIPTR